MTTITSEALQRTPPDQCEHKTAVQVAAFGPYAVERCEWGCDSLLFCHTSNGLTWVSIVTDDQQPFVEMAIEADKALREAKAELAACRQMCQRVATESGDSVAWALKMGVQNGSIQLTPLDFRGWDEGCDCAECQQQRAVYAWLFGEAAERVVRG